MTTQIAIRVDDGQLEAIDGLVPRLYKSRSELIRRAVDAHIYRLRCERDAAIYDKYPMTEEEFNWARDESIWKTAPKW